MSKTTTPTRYPGSLDYTPCCKTCAAGGYVLSLDKVSCSHTEEYYDPDYVCDLYRSNR